MFNLKRYRASLATALTLALLTAGMGTATPAHAADWPSRTIKVVAPSAAGGGADLIARLVARILEDKLKQGTIVENRAGAGGILGTAYVRNAAPDGYTFLVSTSSTHSANQYLYKELPYDAVKDFEQISLIGTFGSVALVAPNSPFKTLPDLTTYASAHPDKVFFGYYSSSSQVPPELLKAQAKLPINGVAYKNVTQIITDLIGGQIDFAFVDYLTAMGPLKGGQLRPLAVTGAERQSAWPDVPTMSTYLPGFSVVGWYGLSAPAGTPKDIIDKVQAALDSELNKPDVKAKFEGYGVSIKTMDHAQFTQFVKDDRRNWAEWVKIAKIQPQ